MEYMNSIVMTSVRILNVDILFPFFPPVLAWTATIKVITNSIKPRRSF